MNDVEGKSRGYLEKILKRNPNLFIDDLRHVEEGIFVIIGRALVEYADELYLTSHTPKECAKTSYRLWIEKPPISRSGHPDWLPELAVAEMWKIREHNRDEPIWRIRNYDTDKQIYSQIAKTAYSNTADPYPFPDIVRNGGWFCSESRIYKIK
ncbi:hypothetical protein HYU07_00850 [Candidatus Woesearchaeota archaeon]|nr:hypothetical protein [Candidatus Woesearchaeota archaeon]